MVWRGKGEPTLKPTPAKALAVTDQASLALASEALALVLTGSGRWGGRIFLSPSGFF